MATQQDNRTSAALTKEQIQSNFDLGIALALWEWPALTVAVQNQWGGPDSAGKREWLAGVLSDLFASQPLTDSEDVQIVLLQVMQDEFDVNVEDDSEEAVADRILKLRKEISEGNLSTLNELQERFDKRKGKAAPIGNIQVTEHVHTGDGGEDEDLSDDDDDDNEEEEDDDEMDVDDAPSLVPAKKEKPEPEVDEDGFTKVTRKR